MSLRLTRRLAITLAAYWTNPYVRQRELAARFGVGRTAIAMRIARAKAQCEADGITLPQRPRKIRCRNIRLAQLSACGSLSATA